MLCQEFELKALKKAILEIGVNSKELMEIEKPKLLPIIPLCYLRCLPTALCSSPICKHMAFLSNLVSKQLA
ncbi:MAG: hypothetical protein K1000chlam3_01044, partial [Chlamydiae bacterium]|nr:hypothetical protein [Chlamydiota bacterium]